MSRQDYNKYILESTNNLMLELDKAEAEGRILDKITRAKLDIALEHDSVSHIATNFELIPELRRGIDGTMKRVEDSHRKGVKDSYHTELARFYTAMLTEFLK